MDKMLRSQGDIDPMNEPFQLSEIPLGAASFPDPLPLSIIGTAGPSTGMDLRRWQQSPEGRYTTDDVRAMARVIAEGRLAALRINGAHVRPADRLPTVIRFAREAIAQSGRKNVRVLLDLGGPKIRTRNSEPVPVAEPVGSSKQPKSGATHVILSTRSAESASQEGIPVVPVSYPGLIEDIRDGAWIRIDDGQVTLGVERVDRVLGHIHCRVLRGDRIDPGKGLNLVGASISAPNLTADLDLPQLESLVAELEVEEWPEFISLSFVKCAEDVRIFKNTFLRLAEKHGRKVLCAPSVIAKIERFELFDCLEDAIRLGDHTRVDLLTFVESDSVEAALGAHFPYSLATVQQQAFRYDYVYRQLAINNLVPSERQIRLQGLEPERVVRGLYALREILRIMGEVDAVMYARGDLSVEIDPRRTAVLRDFFQMCARRKGVAEIIATDILPSLRLGTRITAAEGEALANLARVRPSAIMASNEIAVGRDPVYVVHEIYNSVLYLLSTLFGRDPVQELVSGYTRRNTVSQPDALAGTFHEEIRAALDMLTRKSCHLDYTLEDHPGMIDRDPAKIFVIVGLFPRETPFARTPGERLLRLIASQRPGPPIVPVRLGQVPIPSFLDWGVRPPVTVPDFIGQDFNHLSILLKRLAEMGVTTAGERCAIFWLNDRQQVQVFCGEVPQE